jgi:hypothetical protein
MPNVDITVDADLRKLFNLPPCSDISIPGPKPLKVQLPTGGSISAFADISKGIPTDCSMTFSLLLQLAPFLAATECLLKVLKLLKPLIDIIHGLTKVPPSPPVKAVEEFVKAAVDLAPCLLVPTPASIIPFVRDLPARLAAGIHGLLWILDRAGARVFSFDRDGRQRTMLAGLTAPQAVAADAHGKVAVLDGNDVKLFGRADDASVSLGEVPAAASITFGPGGFVYVGTLTGLIYSFAPDANGSWRAVGVGVLGKAAAINRLIWQGGTTLFALVQLSSAPAAQLWQIDTKAAFVPRGMLSSDELNSGLTGCVWHRIALDADLPSGTAIEVRTEAYDTSGGSAAPDLIPAPIVLAAGNLDCLIQGGPGQYLKLTLTLRGNGSATPALRGIRIWYPRASWLQFLPAVYQEDDESASFLSRFLSILQTDFDGFDETMGGDDQRRAAVEP